MYINAKKLEDLKLSEPKSTLLWASSMVRFVTYKATCFGSGIF
jgi:hypothetical protein